MQSNGGMPPGGPEPDEPIAEIGELSVEPSAGFTGRLLHRIERRETSNHALWFAWTLPAALFLTIIDMLFGVFSSQPNDEGSSK